MTSDQCDDLNFFVNDPLRKKILEKEFYKDAFVRVKFKDKYAAAGEFENKTTNLVGTIYVPKSLVVIRTENKNLDKFKNEESFNKWYRKCTEDTIYKKLYKPVLDNFKKNSYTFKEKKEHIQGWDREMLCCAQGTLDHELAHIKNKHTEKRIRNNLKVAIGIGLIALPAFLRKNKINTAFSSYLAYDVLTKKGRRDREKEADAGVRDDVDILRAMANYFERQEKEKNPLTRALDSILSPLSTHPSDRYRKNYFNSRADALEQE